MKLLINGENAVFNSEVVKRCALIRAQHITWNEARNGIIAFVSPLFVRVIFLTGVNTSASYFMIKASEVSGGQWTIMLTNDMESVYVQQNASTVDLVTEVKKLFKEETGNGN